MKELKRLLEFSFGLIDIQIKKYKNLRSLAFEPDADFRAKLVFSEINDLLEITNELLRERDTKTFRLFFEQIRFYIEQEAIVANADWLIDPSITQERVKDRLTKQLRQLKAIAQSLHYDMSKPAKPVKLTQDQCYYNSITIAASVLNQASFYSNFPGTKYADIDEARHTLLESRAQTRYVKLRSALSAAHDQCVQVLGTSTRNSCTYSFDLLELDAKGESHRLFNEKLGGLIAWYKLLEPDFILENHSTAFYASGMDTFFNNPEDNTQNPVKQGAIPSNL